MSKRAIGESYRRWGKADQRRRRREGLCLSCDTPAGINPATGKPFARCEVHRKGSSLASQRYMQSRRERWRAVGSCVECGLPCLKNRVTGRPFRLCTKHRIQTAAARKATRANKHQETA